MVAGGATPGCGRRNNQPPGGRTNQRRTARAPWRALKIKCPADRGPRPTATKARPPDARTAGYPSLALRAPEPRDKMRPWWSDCRSFSMGGR